MSKRRDAANDEAGKRTSLIRRSTTNLLFLREAECAGECGEINAICTRHQAEHAARLRSPLNGEDETLDDLPNLNAERGRCLCGGGGALRHGLRVHVDPGVAARRHDSLGECTSLR